MKSLLSAFFVFFAVSFPLQALGIDLNSGWNLVSVQVESEQPVRDYLSGRLFVNGVAVADVDTIIRRIWSYEKTWLSYSNNSGNLDKFRPGQGYWFYLSAPAVLTIGGGAPVAPSGVETPLNVSALPGNTQVTVSWSAVSEADGYIVYYGNASGVNKTSLSTAVPAIETAVVITDLQNNSDYYFRVGARDERGDSLLSTEVMAKPLRTGSFSGFIHHFTNPYVTKNVSERQDDIDRMKEIGASWVREGIYWAEFEKAEYVYDFSAIQSSMNQYRDSGLKVLGLFGFSNPLYAKDKFHFAELKDGLSLPTSYSTSSEYIIDKFAAAFEAAILNFPEITHYQILNEVNYDHHFKGGTSPVITYRNILAKIKPVAEAHNKKIVAAGILLGATAEGWLTALTSSSFAGNYDVLALHPYSFPEPLSTHVFNGQTFAQLLNGIRVNWSNNSVTTKPVWITEMGWLFNDTVTATQREWGWIDASEWMNMLADVVSLCNYQDVERLFLYSFEDDAHIVPEQDYAGERLFFGVQKKGGEMKLDTQTIKNTLQ